MVIVIIITQYYFQVPQGYFVAQKHFKSGNHQAALERINKSIESYPQDCNAYYLRALIHLSKMCLDEAKSDIAKIQTIDSDSLLIEHILGQMYYLQGEYTKAKNCYNNSCYNWSAQVCLGQICYRLEEYEDARIILKTAIFVGLPNEQKLLAYYYLGCSCKKLGRLGEANKTFEDMKRWSRGLGELKRVYQPWSRNYLEIQQMQKDITKIEALVS